MNINAEYLNSAPLLRVYTGNGIEGSNPFLPASAALKYQGFLVGWGSGTGRAK